jgi:hypothetical protein
MEEETKLKEKKTQVIDDSNIKFHVWDITNDGTDLKDLPLDTRQKALKRLDFSNRITETDRKIVKGNEIESAIKWASNLKDSEGAVIKDIDAKYTYGESSNSWIKFRHLTPINVQVIKTIPKERNLFNYLVGVPATKKFLNPKYIENNLLILGHTFNSKDKYNPGDKINILVEEVWRHEDPDGIHYSIHKPRVGDKVDKLSTIDYLEDIVTSIGVSIKHSVIDNSEVLELDENIDYIELKDAEGKEISPRDFPNLMQEIFRKSIGKSYRYVLQWHYRGHAITEEDRKKYSIPEKYKWWMKSLHTDSRFDNNSDLLMGITLLSPTSTDKDVPDLVNQDMKNVRAVLKLPQPKEWIDYEGIRHLGEAGTTANAPAILVIVGKGKYTPLEIEDHKLIVAFSSDEGKVNLNIIKKADKEGIYIDRIPDENLKKLPQKVSFHIAHIGDRYLILVDGLKNSKL